MANGTMYYSETIKKWIFQYHINGKRQSIRQRKNESTKDFKKRVTEIKSQLNNDTYIGKSTETVISILEQYITNKYLDGTTSERSYTREIQSLQQIKRTCENFCNKPIQNVTIKDIEKSKDKIKVYANNTISKIWELLNKAFSIAYSPSRKILSINIMQDETLKKPLSIKKNKKVESLSKEEYEKLLYILDYKERNHKFRNVVKMQLISGMRIGEVLARSIYDLDAKTLKFNVYNTLTQDKASKVIWGEHTKTYNKKTNIDEGQRYLPLDNKLLAELIEIIEEQKRKKITNIRGLLFWDYTNNDFITPSEINSWLLRLNEKYKICKSSLSSHRLRHTALTHWRNKGIPMSVIQYLAGHVEGSKITQDVYIDTSIEYVEDELKKIV